ncbi:MAG: hypothetical protein KBG15_15190 [Kofleriaceae bacterium]|nr:hypothetical protein [Kofleriaceae bacterium]
MNLNTNFDASGNVVAKDNRLVAGVLVLVAIAGLAFAMVSKRWLANTAGFGELGFGLLSFSACTEGSAEYEIKASCQTRSNSAVVAEIQNEHGSASGAFPIFGYITLGAIGLAVLSLLATVPLAFRKPADAQAMLEKLPMAPTTAALLTMFVALITGCVFVAIKPGGVGAVGVGWGFWGFGVAVITGMTGAIMIGKQLGPKAHDAQWQA